MVARCRDFARTSAKRRVSSCLNRRIALEAAVGDVIAEADRFAWRLGGWFFEDAGGGDASSRVDAGGEREERRGKKAARFGDHLDAALRRKVGVKRGANCICKLKRRVDEKTVARSKKTSRVVVVDDVVTLAAAHFFKCRFVLSAYTRETAAQVKQIHIEAERRAQIKKRSRIFDRALKTARLRIAAAHWKSICALQATAAIAKPHTYREMRCRRR